MRGRLRTAFREWIYPRHSHVLRVRDMTGAYREVSVSCVRHKDSSMSLLASTAKRRFC
jgi:hypothetical protein